MELCLISKRGAPFPSMLVIYGRLDRRIGQATAGGRDDLAPGHQRQILRSRNSAIQPWPSIHSCLPRGEIQNREYISNGNYQSISYRHRHTPGEGDPYLRHHGLLAPRDRLKRQEEKETWDSEISSSTTRLNTTESSSTPRWSGIDTFFCQTQKNVV